MSVKLHVVYKKKKNMKRVFDNAENYPGNMQKFCKDIICDLCVIDKATHQLTRTIYSRH